MRDRYAPHQSIVDQVCAERAENLYQATLSQDLTRLETTLCEIQKPIVTAYGTRTLYTAVEYDILQPALSKLFADKVPGETIEFLLDNYKKCRFFADHTLDSIAAEATANGYDGLIQKFNNAGVGINGIAEGYARKGDAEKALACLSRGATIQYIAMGAGKGGHENLSNELITIHGANADDVAYGAGAFKHAKLTKRLIANGANPYCAIRGAIHNKQFEFAQELQLPYLVALQIPSSTELSLHQYRISEIVGMASDQLIQKAADIVSLEINNRMNEEEAWAVTEPSNQGPLIFMLSLVAFRNPELLKTGMPLEVLLHIFSYNFGYQSEKINPTIGFGLFLDKKLSGKYAALDKEGPDSKQYRAEPAHKC
jgi:hypothetical protein